jgi:hypothetical protein
MLPAVRLQESNVDRQGWLGRVPGSGRTIPTPCIPPGDDHGHERRWIAFSVERPASLRPEVGLESASDPPRCACVISINERMPTINAAVENQQLDEYFAQGTLPWWFPARLANAFDLGQEIRSTARMPMVANAFGQTLLARSSTRRSWYTRASKWYGPRSPIATIILGTITSTCPSG